MHTSSRWITVTCAATMLLATIARAEPGGVAEPERGTRTMGDVDGDAGRRPPDSEAASPRPAPPDPDEPTRHEPGTHGGSMPGAMPTMPRTGPTHPPGTNDEEGR